MTAPINGINGINLGSMIEAFSLLAAMFGPDAVSSLFGGQNNAGMGQMPGGIGAQNGGMGQPPGGIGGQNQFNEWLQGLENLGLLPSGLGGLPGGTGGLGQYPGGTDQFTGSPLAQKGVPTVTDANKTQAIGQYLSTHSVVNNTQDANLLMDSLSRLSKGELNLLFKEGATWNFTNNGPGFNQNALGDESNRNVLLNENAMQDPTLSNTSKEQVILHETTHALDDSLARALNLPTEMASEADPNIAQAWQNFRPGTWDQSQTDPSGKYPAISDPQELVADAGKFLNMGMGANMAAQDPATYNAVMTLLQAADLVGNRLAGLA